MLREVGRALVDVDKLDELGVQVGVAEGTVGHEGVVEMPRIVGVALEGEKVGDLCLCEARRVGLCIC